MKMGRLSITSTIGAVFLAALSVEAFAGPEGYCHAYSRDIANRKAGTTAGNAFNGISLGMITGEVVEGASSGTVLSTGDANTKLRRAYINAYDDCMKQYEPEKVMAASAQPEVQADQPVDEQVTDEAVTEEQPVEQVEAPVEEPVEQPVKKAAKAKAKNKPEPGTQAWNNACDKRYRSFNPKTGMYMSRSGKMKKCQL